jgi:cystathionine beta-synthase
MKSIQLPVSETGRVYDNILQTIGNTPLVRLGRIGRSLPCALYAKVEYFNPGGSIKDRIASRIIEEAERSGRLRPGGTVIEATSGNTGVGLAITAIQKGYKFVFVMPDKMSQEKIQLLRAYGARVVITPTAVEPDDPRSYYSVSRQMAAETPNAILANQYHNPENPASHYESTGPELWQQTSGKITDLVVCLGTGGTITGTGRYLKEQNPDIRLVGVDPVGSILLESWQNGGAIPPDAKASPYKVEGFGEDFIPSTLDLSILNDIVRVGDKESFLWARRLVHEEGIFAGGSSGAALAAAVRYIRELGRGNGHPIEDRLVVVILPDAGSRYLSKLYDDKWMRENGFLDPDWSETSLSDVLAAKPAANLITARLDDRVTDVIAVLRENNVSQVPALHPDGTLAGLITEVDLLKHILEAGRQHSQDERVARVVHQTQAVYPASTPLQIVLPVLAEDQVVLVTDRDRPVGILTRIDVLDFISHKI